jgi:hypothetical protein
MEDNLFSEEPNIFAKLERNKLHTFTSGKKNAVKDRKGKDAFPTIFFSMPFLQYSLATPGLWSIN